MKIEVQLWFYREVEDGYIRYSTKKSLRSVASKWRWSWNADKHLGSFEPLLTAVGYCLERLNEV